MQILKHKLFEIHEQSKQFKQKIYMFTYTRLKWKRISNKKIFNASFNKKYACSYVDKGGDGKAIGELIWSFAT